jgi:hypothetical protein
MKDVRKSHRGCRWARRIGEDGYEHPRAKTWSGSPKKEKDRYKIKTRLKKGDWD